MGTTTTKLFDKASFIPPKDSLLSIRTEKDIQGLNVKDLKVCSKFVSWFYDYL